MKNIEGDYVVYRLDNETCDRIEYSTTATLPDDARGVTYMVPKREDRELFNRKERRKAEAIKRKRK